MSDVLQTKLSRILPRGIDPERLSVRTVPTRKSRGPGDKVYRVPPSFSDGRHTACKRKRCPGCLGMIIEEPCRLCEVREGKGLGISTMPRVKEFAETTTVASSDELTPLESHALAKAAKRLPELRDRLTVGDAQPVDFTVRIRGVVSVAADTASTTRETAPADKVLAAVLSRMTPRARKVMAFEVQALFADFAAGGELPTLEDRAIDLADDVLASASREVNKSKRGNVSAALEVTLKKRG